MAVSANTKRLVLLTWLLVAIFYFYLSYDYIRVSMNDREFGEYVQYVVQIAGAEHRPAREVRALILVKAEELSLPLRSDQIVVKGGGDTLNVAINYDIDIEVPLLRREVYSKNFEHKVNFRSSK
jgi:hypothetical protein